MRDWRWMLGGLSIWALHFLGVYGVASIADISAPSEAATWTTVGIGFSLACLMALAVIAVRIRTVPAISELARLLGQAGAVIGFIAVAWESLPLVL